MTVNASIISMAEQYRGWRGTAAELAERLTQAWNDDPALADKIVIAPPMIKLPDAPTFPGEFTIAHDEQTHD